MVQVKTRGHCMHTQTRLLFKLQVIAPLAPHHGYCNYSSVGYLFYKTATSEHSTLGE